MAILLVDAKTVQDHGRHKRTERSSNEVAEIEGTAQEVALQQSPRTRTRTRRTPSAAALPAAQR